MAFGGFQVFGVSVLNFGDEVWGSGQAVVEFIDEYDMKRRASHTFHVYMLWKGIDMEVSHNEGAIFGIPTIMIIVS